MGNMKQGRKKARARSIDMSSGAQEDAGDQWSPPDEADCDPAQFTMAPPGGDIESDRIIVRTSTDPIRGGQLVDFAVVHMTRYRRKWRNVAKADSAHDHEVHVHRFARSGPPDDQEGHREPPICAISEAAHVQMGYDLAYEQVVGKWDDNKRRWHDA